MKKAAFEQFLDACVSEAKRKNARLEKDLQIHTYERWDYDEEAQTITFSNPGRRGVLEFRYTDVGTYSLETESWLWAWANESNSDEMVEKATALQDLYETTRQPMFQEPLIECDEYLAWALAAAAVHHFDSLGVYRAPVDHLWVFLSLDEVVAPKAKH